LCKGLTTQVSMNTSQSTKSTRGDTYAFEVREFDAPIIANHHVLHMTFAVHQHSNLSTSFVGEFA
jgi:hypothetical protein